MKNENYILIQGWMINELQLKGNDLLVFAIIYGFCQVEDCRYTGGLQYLADCCGCTKQGISKNIRNLLDLGYIEKFERVQNRIKHCDYTIKHSCIPLNFVVQGIQQSLMNNINNKKDNNTIINNSIIRKPQKDSAKPKRKNLYQQCVEEIILHNFPAELDSMLRDYLSLRLKIEDKPIYNVNQWKAILKKLVNELAPDDVEMQKAIVQQSIERGYASFFPVSKSSSSRKRNVDSGVSSDQYTEEEKREIRKWQKEVVKNGGRIKF